VNKKEGENKIMAEIAIRTGKPKSTMPILDSAIRPPNPPLRESECQQLFRMDVKKIESFIISFDNT